MTVKELRKEKNKTQLELSVDIGISIQQLQKIEQGKILLKDVKYSTVEALHKILCSERYGIQYFVKECDFNIWIEKEREQIKKGV